MSYYVYRWCNKSWPQIKVKFSTHYSTYLKWDTEKPWMTCNQSRPLGSAHLSLGRPAALRLLLMFTLPVSLSWFRAFNPAVGTLAKLFTLRSLVRATDLYKTCIQMHVHFDGLDRICILRESSGLTGWSGRWESERHLGGWTLVHFCSGL